MSSQRIRILYIHNSADLYGASRSLLRLAGQIDRSRFQPMVLLPESGLLSERLEKLGVPIFIQKRLAIIDRSSLAPWRLLLLLIHFPLSVLAIRRLIRREKIDLVHTNTAVIAGGAIAARIAGVPHLWHIREWFQEFRRFWQPYSACMIWSSRFIIAVSRAVALQFRRQDRVEVVPNGFSLDEFNVDRSSLGRDFRGRYRLENHLVVGTVGRIKLVRKGQEVLIAAAAILRDQGRSARFVIVGSPFRGNEGHLEKLHAMIRELRLEKEVVFTGEMQDTRPAFAAMDLFVLPSAQPEPFGGVVMEAMAMELPVIATNIGGSLDQVVENVTGFLVPPADARVLADRIASLMDDPERRARMGRAGRERIANHFSLSEMVKRMELLYERALKSR